MTRELKLGERGWDDDDPAVAVRHIREHLPGFLGCGKDPSDTGHTEKCVHCGFFCSRKWGARLIRGSWLSQRPVECVWCVRRLKLEPPWPEKYELPEYP